MVSERVTIELLSKSDEPSTSTKTSHRPRPLGETAGVSAARAILRRGFEDAVAEELRDESGVLGTNGCDPVE